jgi:feruloyl esterase
MRPSNVVIALLLALPAAAGAQTPTASGAAERCAALAAFTVPGAVLEVNRTEWVPAGSPVPAPMPGMPAPAGTLPAHCRFDGTIDPRTGAGGQRFGIGFAVALPDGWNGRLLMQGGGGLNGRVAPPIGGVASGETPGLLRGFAVVSTDTGHTGAVFDAGFMRDQQAALDFAYVAIGRVAAIAKGVVASYYGKPAHHAYYTGCSTGGREGMVMAQRYPAYFDGIVSGAPAMRTGHSNLALRAMVEAFSRIAPRDPSGKPLPAFSDGDRKAIIDALLGACDTRDAVKDGLIFDVRGCRFDPAALACRGAKSDGCLSAEQVAAVAKAFAGPKDATGRQVYSAFPYDTGIAASGRTIPGILSPGAGPPVPPRLAEHDVTKEAQAVEADAQAILTDTWTWTNLNAFSSRGGKLLFYHGVSDPWFSALDTVEYYERLAPANGGTDGVRAFSRLFLSPGMGHCGGGQGALDRFDLLSAVVEWVENGTAPDAVTATGASVAGRSRPLCAYPQYAHYKGQGDPEDARSFECRTSAGVR